MLVHLQSVLNWKAAGHIQQNLHHALKQVKSLLTDMVVGCSYCSDNFFNKSREIPAVLNGPSLTVTLTTGTCAIVKDKTDEGKNDLLEGSLTCVGPELSYEKVYYCTMSLQELMSDMCWP